MSIQTTTLSNGIRVVTDAVPNSHTVAVGVWAAVGTRHEDMRENGVAHMVEHMLFKGTPSRNAQKIAEVIENVGGDINAYTDREMTAYYIHLMREHLDLALEVLSDILQNSTMPEDEVERERGVILQEIKMYQDTPDRLVFDNFQEAAYPGQSLGAPALGSKKLISKMSRDSLMNYALTHYTGANLIISAAGDIAHEEFVRKIETLFGGIAKGEVSPYKAAQYAPQSSRQEKKTEQSHIVLGFQSFRRSDPRYPALRLLSSVLGGGMSSRLFQEIREKRGLVYSISSFQDPFHDDGIFGVYAGTGPEHLPELMPVMIDEIRKVSQDISDEELMRAKAQLKAGIYMSRESLLTRADQQARYMINYNHPFEIAAMTQKIDAVAADDLMCIAESVFASKPVLAAIGPLKKLMDDGEIGKRLAA